MKMIFMDTNVIIDFLTDRRPFSLHAAQIFNASLSGKIKIFVSSVSYNNIYYILRQSLTHLQTINLLLQLNDLTEVVDVTTNVISKSLTSDFKDFEDAIQYNCALTVKNLDFILTRDSKDFKKSSLPVMNPQEAIGVIAGIN